MSNSSTPRNNQSDLDKFLAYLYANRFELMIAGGWISLGYFLGKTSRPKVNEMAIVDKWLTGQVNDGINVYGLTNDQKALWESTWAFVNAYAKDWGIPLNTAMADFVRRYSAGIEELANK